MPTAWWNSPKGVVRPHSGKFKVMHRLLNDKPTRALFDKEWVPQLLKLFAEQKGQNKFRLMGKELSLKIGGDWAYCQSCRTAQRPLPRRTTCVNCGRDTAPIDPDTDPVFVARKGYYRASTLDALLTPPTPPMVLIPIR